jgi:hypothetical protein
MTLRSQIEANLEQYFGMTTYEPAIGINEMRKQLAQARERVVDYIPHPSASNPDSIEAGHFIAAFHLARMGFIDGAENILLDWWEDFGLRQVNQEKRIYRAIIALWLADVHLQAGNRGTAFRWLLHTQADDAFDEHNGAGTDRLKANFDISDDDLNKLNSLAKSYRDKTNYLGKQWLTPTVFPEEIVRKFIENDTNFLMTRLTSSQPFPLSKSYFTALMKYADEILEGNNSRAKGQILEDIAAYLLLLLPGYVPRRNLLDQDLVGETDVLVTNLNQTPDITIDLLGRHFLVECKNCAQRVGVRDVGYFLYRMKLAHVQFGIIFSNEGITGDRKKEKAARALVRRAFHEDKSLCVIIDRKDLDELANQEKPSFWAMLLRKIEEFRFGKPKK